MTAETYFVTDIEAGGPVPGPYSMLSLAGVFRNHPNVTGVTLNWSAESAHTATPEAPYWSPLGAESARIDAAQARGELTPAEAIEALKKIHRPAGE